MSAVPVRYTVFAAPLGTVLLAATDAGLCAAALGDDAAPLVDDLRARHPSATRDDEALRVWAEAFAAYLSGTRHALDVGPLDLHGTAFQRRVWAALRTIPYGQTLTYADLTARLGQPEALRAVAQACAANPVALAVPCHRIVHVGGGISGYRWGSGRKRRLLALERGQTDLFGP